MVSVVTAHLNSVMSSVVPMASAKHTYAVACALVCVCVCVCVCVAWRWHVPFFMLMVHFQISSSLGMPCGANRTATRIQV